MTPSKTPPQLPEAVARYRAAHEAVQNNPAMLLSDPSSGLKCAEAMQELELARMAMFDAATLAAAAGVEVACRHEWTTVGRGGVAKRDLACMKCGQHRDHMPSPASPPVEGLPGMWDRSDFTGGDPYERSHSARTEGQEDQPDEDAYVIQQLGRLLAEIAVIVKGPEPAGTLWSYHDLPALVERLKDTQRADLVDRFRRCSYAVCTTIDPRGYRWSEAYLDEMLRDLAPDQSTPPEGQSVEQRARELPPTEEWLLRGMVLNYGDGTGDRKHQWDHLDRNACQRAAEEIAALRAALSAQAPSEAVATVVRIGGVNERGIMAVQWTTRYQDLPPGTKLYAAPQARGVDHG